jgi:hypothetical protein
MNPNIAVRVILVSSMLIRAPEYPDVSPARQVTPVATESLPSLLGHRDLDPLVLQADERIRRGGHLRR